VNTLYGDRLQPVDKIIPGMIIAYRLLPKDMPKNPNKVWRGQALKCDEQNILVKLLEQGYEGVFDT
jgi:hypothetical protein